jgi:hypothetical protein
MPTVRSKRIREKSLCIGQPVNTELTKQLIKLEQELGYFRSAGYSRRIKNAICIN